MLSLEACQVPHSYTSPQDGSIETQANGHIETLFRLQLQIENVALSGTSCRLRR